MPRRARLRLAGLPLHIIQRGNNRTPCFYAGEDFGLYLHHLGQLAPRFECAVHAYVLMTNHVHLLLTPARADGPSLLMKHPRDYSWSSYCVNAEVHASTLIVPHQEYLGLGETREQRASVYRRSFRFELDPADLREIRSAANGGFALGNDRFKSEIGAMLGRRVERLRDRDSPRVPS